MIRDLRELVGMVPAVALLHAFDCLPEGVKQRTRPSVIAGAPAAWALAYAVARYARNGVLAVAR